MEINEMSKKELLGHLATVDETLVSTNETIAEVSNNLAKLDKMLIDATADKYNLEYMRDQILAKLAHPVRYVAMTTLHSKRPPMKLGTLH